MHRYCINNWCRYFVFLPPLYVLATPYWVGSLLAGPSGHCGLSDFLDHGGVWVPGSGGSGQPPLPPAADPGRSQPANVCASLQNVGFCSEKYVFTVFMWRLYLMLQFAVICQQTWSYIRTLQSILVRVAWAWLQNLTVVESSCVPVEEV